LWCDPQTGLRIDFWAWAGYEGPIIVLQ
jgi:hypothetical protein